MRVVAVALGGFALLPSGGAANAHPHVFVEANLEIMRDSSGAISELRHVWRFDEMFSTTILLDFDTNGDGALEIAELEAVSQIVTESIGESNFFTEVRQAGKPVEFNGPERIMVDYVDGQVLMFFAVIFHRPVDISDGNFKVSVSDPTYFVAMEIASEAAIQISGNGRECRADITRPDFDQLYAANKSTLTEQFFADPVNATLGDEWKTWIGLSCG
jgi:ABC-type uncharacterized transport system substrate-binding protein